MARILKYPLRPYGDSFVSAGIARFLHVEWQGAELMLWAEAYEAQPASDHHLITYMTGDSVDPRATYVGTATQPEQGYVAHVYVMRP